MVSSLLEKVYFYIKNLNNKYIILGNLYNTAVKWINSFAWKKGVRCNICEWQGYKFYAMISYRSIRFNAVCPQCFSKERHRRLILYLEDNAILRSGLSCLDIGPVRSFKKYLESKGCFYFSIDIHSPLAMSKMDITHLGIQSDGFELIICYHVLEHVKNDLIAIREIYRVLKPGGKCLIQVPLDKNRLDTTEYREPDEKDCDHVRSYGRDVTTRISNEGFIVNEVDKTFGDEKKINEFALNETDGTFFICQKRI